MQIANRLHKGSVGQIVILDRRTQPPTSAPLIHYLKQISCVEQKTTNQALRHISRNKTNVYSDECVHITAYSAFKLTLNEDHRLIHQAVV